MKKALVTTPEAEIAGIENAEGYKSMILKSFE